MNTNTEKLADLFWQTELKKEDLGKSCFQIWEFRFGEHRHNCLYLGELSEDDFYAENHKVVAYAQLCENETSFADELLKTIKARKENVERIEKHFAKMKNEDKLHEIKDLLSDINENF